MPKLPIDYNNCCIYKIEHIDNERLLYVGQTTNFSRRKGEHKRCCNDKKYTKHNYKLYQMIRENGGWEMFRMIEIEKYPCNDRREADKRENEIMKELKANMNTIQNFNPNTRHKERKQELQIKKYEEYTRRLKYFKWCNDNKEEHERLKSLFD